MRGSRRDAFLGRSVNEDGVFLDPAYLAQRCHLSYVGDMLNGVLDATQMVR